ncbi:DUF6114 domain-containing protein [Wenjunlia tyrosinilytica]|jgi:hypothetical protein|uniref:Integral membrane protein n=1 Tax=Wenjunlia tyrosinilytica TaxID=1544741 RepID=A0A917ZVS0_9ACTN|nr:DUF6114 domain-containing protein [Wenjunlia tyrosinilytica]GGO92815.1 hypothetical protein GCM10012280_43850 [Wenjunlia tyrosinilytica]
MSAESRRRPTEGGFGRARVSFRNWRGQRPFWGGLLTLLAGLPIAYFPYANLSLGSLTVRMATTAGAGSLIIGVLLMVLGLTMWFQPMSRVFAGVAAILLSLVSLVVSNFGGFVIGFLLGLIGGGLGISWVAGEVVEDGDDGDPATRPGPAPDAGGEPAAAPAQPVSAGSTDQPTNGRDHRAG